MKISILTLFPELFEPILSTSILGRAQKKGLVEYQVINIRDFAKNSYKTVDDKPYGGGAGMILKADILAEAIRAAYGDRHTAVDQKPVAKTILTSASGTPFNQQKARDLSQLDHLIIVCGHYEGVDQRFIDKYVDEEISIGDYVLTGGELPALVITDAVVRLIPRVLEKPEATQNESFSEIRNPKSEIRLLEYPQYTRPEEFEGVKVPPVLLSGDHNQIAAWRKEQSFQKTKKVRPDLLLKGIDLANRDATG